MGRLRKLAPYAAPALLAAWPVLFLAGSNPGEFAVGDMVVTALLAAAAGALCMLAAVALVGRRRAAIPAAVVLVGLLYAPALIADLRRTERLGIAAHGPMLPTLLALLALLAILWLRRAGPAVVPAVRPVVILCAALVGIAGGQAALSAWRSVPPSPAARPQVSLAADSLPDIYLLVLDQYASGAVLKWRFGIDNAPFEDSLRTLGFRLPEATWTNYPFTAAAVASLLDMRHVASIADSVPPGEQSLVAFNRIIADNAAFRLARERGYRVVFVPSPGFHGTRSHAGADLVLGPRSIVDRLGAHATSPLALETAKLSLLGTALAGAGVRLGSPWRELAPFRALHAAIDEPGPKFVFAHAMTTHEPFLFTDTCRWARRQRLPYAEAYGQQVRCTNRQLHALLEAIGRSPRPSIVLLQSDHGTSSLGARSLEDPALLSEEQAAERFGAFAAYRLPDGTSLGDTITPVNLLRLVFNRYLGTSYPQLPNDAYHGVVTRTYDLVPVDGRVLGDTIHRSATPGSAVRPARRAVAAAVEH